MGMIVLFGFLTVCLAGCSSSDTASGTTDSGAAASGPTDGSGSGAGFVCDYPNFMRRGHQCWAWDEGFIMGQTHIRDGYKMRCIEDGGMEVASCSTAGALGKCTRTAPGADESIHVHYYAPTTLAAAMQDCRGVWTSL